MNTGSHKARRGIAIVDVLAVLAVAGIGAATLVPAADMARHSARGPKDATQLRGIAQSMVIWANTNKDRFPLPSEMDKANDTVKEEGAAKDTSANLFSLMLWNEMFTAEFIVSPYEPNEKIKPHTNYEYQNPTTAVNPDRAQWDPKFSVDFTAGGGSLSYAHQCLNEERTKRKWRNTFDSRVPLLSTRGPKQIGEIVRDEDTVSPTFEENFLSNTFAFESPTDSWSGHIVYVDSHTELVDARMQPDAVYFVDHDDPNRKKSANTDAPFTRTRGMRDWLFLDESEDETGTNNFLSIFITAGAKRTDFKAIWD
ncbi:MAG: hypothetical protein H6815_09390 [Phycisphaeraceae bacterium]|nr:hypothetical protein [Phycisphaerales bacterium]MCB9860651.1 hypothetical protein [Phycisphaeraceae bacterium]